MVRDEGEEKWNPFRDAERVVKLNIQNQILVMQRIMMNNFIMGIGIVYVLCESMKCICVVFLNQKCICVVR
jgi:hypothetical protein